MWYNKCMKIICPEIANPGVARAFQSFPSITPVEAAGLEEAVSLLAAGEADSILTGLDYSTRDVLLAFKEHLPLKSKFFSSCFVCQRREQYLVLADGGVIKQPDTEQLYTIVEDTARTFEQFFGTQPKIAMLSYSTQGSGGRNPDLKKIYAAIEQIRQSHPEWAIDGEMQLDAAVVPAIGERKMPASLVAGHANILICPDLNSGNILYKGLEHLGGWTMAGPIVQGFEMPLADLSRGSSIEDIRLTLRVLQKLHNEQRKVSSAVVVKPQEGLDPYHQRRLEQMALEAEARITNN